MLGKGDVILSNQINTFRIDSLRYFDGIFTETNSDPRFTHAAAVAAAGLLSIGSMPAIVWTNSNDEVQTHTWHQQHLLFGVQPMSPYLGNDHSVLPLSITDQFYGSYVPLYALMRGSSWWLKGTISVVTFFPEDDVPSYTTNAFVVRETSILPGNRSFVVLARRIDGATEGVVTLDVDPFPSWINRSSCVLHNSTSSSPLVPPRGSGTFPQCTLSFGLCFVTCLEYLDDVSISVSSEIVHVLGPKFLSFTLDTAFFCDEKESVTFLSDKSVRARLIPLAPFSLRVGGTQGDYSQAAFGPVVEELPGAREKKWGCNYTHAQLSTLASFVTSFGDKDVDLVFGLNALTRAGSIASAAWNESNARALVSCSSLANASLELGNEPELWGLQRFARNLTAKVHAADFAILRGIVEPKQAVIGPDYFVQCLPQFPTCDVTYLQEFLSARPPLDVLTCVLLFYLALCLFPSETIIFVIEVESTTYNTHVLFFSLFSLFFSLF